MAIIETQGTKDRTSRHLRCSRLMRSRVLIRLTSAIVLILIAVYLAASVYFCAGALAGRFGGCVAMTGGDVLGSTTAQIAALAAATGLLYSLPRRRR